MPFAVRLALLLCSGLFIVGVAPRDPLSALLGRMRAFSGPVWSAHLRSVSHVVENGVTVDLRSDASGLRFSSYQCTGALCEGTFFDGERVHSININGTMLPQGGGPDQFLRAERTIASLAFLAPDFTAEGGRIVDDGSTMISGTLYRTLLVTSGDATPMLVYVDPRTSAVTYMRDVNGDVTIEYRGYTSVAGKYQLPMYVYRNGALLERYDHRPVACGR